MDVTTTMDQIKSVAIPVEDVIKRIGLILSDTISTQLKMLFTCKYYEGRKVNYEIVQKLDRKYYTFSLKVGDHPPILNIIDAQIVYILTNRILGGEGIVEVRRFKDLFTFSENYFGKYLINWVIDAYAKNGLNVSCDKIADSPKYYHIFLPDEQVLQYSFEVFSGLQNIGMYYIVMGQEMSGGKS